MVKKEKLARRCKEKMIDDIVGRLEKHPNFFITTYMGLSVSDMEGLRRSLKKSSSSYVVVKNSVLKVVFDKLKLAEASSMIESGMGLSLGSADAISTSKALVTFAKDHNKFKIKAGYIDGKMVGSERIKTLASILSKEALLAQVVGGMKAPITGFVNVLGGVLRKFVYVVDAVKKSKENTNATHGSV